MPYNIIKTNEKFCVSKLNIRNSYLIKGVMFEHLCLKEAHFIKLEFLWKVWLIQNLKCFLLYYRAFA